MKETPILFSEVHALSPETIRAQRMAELAQMAKYRRGKLQEYVDWSSPEKRDERIKKAQAEEMAARQMVSSKHEEFARMFDLDDAQPMMIGRIITKTTEKPWYQRIVSWIKE